MAFVSTDVDTVSEGRPHAGDMGQNALCLGLLAALLGQALSVSTLGDGRRARHLALSQQCICSVTFLIWC